jgi:hypothetical protein
MQHTSIVCYRCGETQESRAKLFQHLALRHRPLQRRNGTETTTRTTGAIAGPTNAEPYCSVCERAFSTAKGLEMHTRTSKGHKANLPRQQAPVPIKHTRATQLPVPDGREPIPEATASNSTQSIINGVSKIELGDTADSNAATDSQCGITSGGASTSNGIQNSVNAGLSKFRYGSNYWTIIAPAQRPAALQTLLEYWHKREDLETHHYRIRPDDPNDISSIWECKNCGSKLKPFNFPYRVRWLNLTQDSESAIKSPELNLTVFSTRYHGVW